MTITNDLELPQDVKETFNYLKTKHGCNIMITNLPSLIEETCGVELSDFSSWTAQFVSYLIDLQRKYMGGGKLDLTVFHQDVINVFHLTKLERQLLVKNNIEDKLWAIMYAVSYPNHQKFIINQND